MNGPADFAALLGVLEHHRVEFVVVGGLAAAIHGCPIPTYDVDVVYDREPANLERLLAALAELQAVFAHDLTGRRLAPSQSHLATPGPKLLQTKFGRLDVLGEINRQTSWEELAAESVPTDLGAATVRVVSLDRLIAIKEWLVSLRLPDRGPRDQLHLLHLRAIAARRKPNP